MAVRSGSLIVGIVILVAAVTTPVSLGQVSYHAAWSKVEFASWTLNPVYEEDAASPGSLKVHSFLALADPHAVVGANLVAVWYVRDGDMWNAKSWSITDPWDAVSFVKAQLEIGDDEDERWSIPHLPGEGQGPVLPEEYTAGVLASDPLAAVILGAPDREVIVSYLASIGYEAADIPVDYTDPCTTDEKLTGLAEEIERGMREGDSDTVLILESATVLCQAAPRAPRIPGPRPPVPPVVPAPNPRGTVPGGPPPGGGWTSGPWSPWSCRSVPISIGDGVNCICSRARRWGRWEARSCWIVFTCTRWIEVIESETCTDVFESGPCPAPGPAANCTPITVY